MWYNVDGDFMQRYFVSEVVSTNNQITITGQDAHHIKNVMRFRVGDEIIVCIPDQPCMQSVIQSFEPTGVLCKMIQPVQNNEMPVQVDLAQALIRRERFEYVLQKATELGVSNIIPIDMKYNLIKWDNNKSDNKLSRWNSITKEASEQSHRNIPVAVTDVKRLTELTFDSYDIVIVADESEAGQATLKDVWLSTYTKILIVIGPEGGFHPDEIAYLSHHQNVKRVGLGKRILRSETASSYLLSVISYVYEMGGL